MFGMAQFGFGQILTTMPTVGVLDKIGFVKSIKFNFCLVLLSTVVTYFYCVRRVFDWRSFVITCLWGI